MDKKIYCNSTHLEIRNTICIHLFSILPHEIYY